MRLKYEGQTVSGFYILLELRRLGLSERAILTYLERAEREAVKEALLRAPCLTDVIQ